MTARVWSISQLIMIADEQGALYGTTQSGGIGGAGTVFKLTPPAKGQTTWTESVLYRLAARLKHAIISRKYSTLMKDFSRDKAISPPFGPRDRPAAVHNHRSSEPFDPFDTGVIVPNRPSTSPLGPAVK